MLTVREGSPCLVTKFLTSFPKIFSSGQQKSHDTELVKVSPMCFSSFAAALCAVSLAVHEDNFEMSYFSSGPASPFAPEIFSGFVPVGISEWCLMRTGSNIEPHIHTGQKCLQAGIQHMLDSKAEERWFWHTYEANEKKLQNSQFSLSTIELDFSKEEKILFLMS